MIFSQEFERVIEHLPEVIMKNKVFIETYGKREETKKSKKEFFSELVNELETEFNYSKNKAKEIMGEKYYTDASSFYFNFFEGKAGPEEEPISKFDKTTDEKFRKYFTYSVSDMPLPVPEKYKRDFFEYVYIRGIYHRCIYKIYEHFFLDANKMIKYLSESKMNVHSDMHLEYNIRMNLRRTIMIDGDIGLDNLIYYTLIREIRWILEKNIDADNYKICMDVDEEDENIYLIKTNETGCFDAKTDMRLTLETKSPKEQNYWEYEVKNNENKLSPYLNLAYQAKVVLNEKMRKVLCGEGNVASVKARLKYLGFLRAGLGDYEAFIIENQSGFYLTYILMEGMIKNRLLQTEDLKQIENFRKSKLKIIERHMPQLLAGCSVKTVLKKIRTDSEWFKEGKAVCSMPNKKIQLILIMFYLISAVHSADISLIVAKIVMDGIESIRNFSDAYIEKTLLNIDNMLLDWVDKFNYKYDFMLEVMVYMYAYKGTDERVRYIEDMGRYPLCQIFMEVDNLMQNVYKGEFSAVRKEKRLSSSIIEKIFIKDSEGTEQKIYRAINDYIIHGSYPKVFDCTK